MKLDKIAIQSITVVLVLIALAWGILETSKHNKLQDEELSKNLFVTVAKIKDLHKNNYKYVFFYDGVKYSAFQRENAGRNSNIGKYFRVEFSSKNPQYSRLKLDEEITKSVKIANSGFRKKTLNEMLDSK